ncbi:AbfB domain-containing protein [Micromonospora deserti]|uniref:Alpha-L-arabinofuranosidase B arabinose-binding domain-containing protein n=1 Tax=Micromonospora deserti TaxID=2070366 RepID=A0A2W2DJ58_9ACTN|nr:AbfB domain-containing protein [Micromonospora deserti]PZG00850.1 hypothetical protein C1I99_08860 [Micromonospora deserti]
MINGSGRHHLPSGAARFRVIAVPAALLVLLAAASFGYVALVDRTDQQGDDLPLVSASASSLPTDDPGYLTISRQPIPGINGSLNSYSPVPNPDRTRVQTPRRTSSPRPPQTTQPTVAQPCTECRFRSYTFPNHYIRHYWFRARLDANVSSLSDAWFRVVTGLSGNGTVSLESANFPGFYLRHKNFEVWLERNDGSGLFRSDASFYLEDGLAEPTGVSFRSYNYPERYIRQVNSLLYIHVISHPTQRGDATYYRE